MSDAPIGRSVERRQERASRARYGVVGFAVVLSVVTYIDRVALAQAAPALAADLDLTQVQIGWAFSAFGFAYFLFQVPGGWLSDRFGPRRVLAGIVLWWSLFTAATGWAWSQASLVVSRFLFGAGQAGGFPVLTKTFTIWLPASERIRAQGIMWLSARWVGPSRRYWSCSYWSVCLGGVRSRSSPSSESSGR